KPIIKKINKNKEESKNTQHQTKNKILTILTIIICVFLTIGGIRALRNYFSQQKKETIKLINGNDAPIFEVKRIDGNNEDKILIQSPCQI
ncbi:MAG: hypothetical protein Q8869_03240, partial [Candidatus Phytoplasma australasiaticum]|nr:hypothetical protein [Candidatus Phytoplasma australasiaticum]